jgi:DHA1 family tetracycline resistance protein-like MFS transporter
VMACSGGVGEIAGFALLIASVHTQSLSLLLIALAVITCGFAFMMPSINSLISRRSDPAKQGGILGIAQSVSSLARILGPMFGIPLLELHNTLPYYVAASLMGVGLLLVIVAARGGQDYVPPVA